MGSDHNKGLEQKILAAGKDLPRGVVGLFSEAGIKGLEHHYFCVDDKGVVAEITKPSGSVLRGAFDRHSEQLKGKTGNSALATQKIPADQLALMH